MLRSLFLQAPSFDGYDGGAGARYQMKREVKSFWFPTWLAQAAAMVPGSRLIDAPPHRLSFKDIEADVKSHELIVIHTSTPSFKSDCLTAQMIRDINPTAKIGFIGAKVAVEPQDSIEACPALDFVCRNEYEFTIKELAEGADWSTIKGLTYRDAAGVIIHNPERPILMDMDLLPSVLPTYKQLKVENYFGGYLLHPYMSWYTGRGCKSRCTFCLWPQTIGGHKYRYRSIETVIEEVKYMQKEFPQVRELFFDDDTLTDDHARVEALAVELGKLGVVWSCNAKANVPRKTLEVLKANGLRLLLVGYESGNQKILHNIKKGILVTVAKQFAKDCHDLGIIVHGTFILGLPGETKETIQETLAFAKEVNPRTLQVSLAAPYPGTFLYAQAKENGWFASDVDLLTDDGTQIAPLSYPDLDHSVIFDSVEDFYKKFYFRPSKIAEIVGEMLTSKDMMVRRLREGVEFFQFLRTREDMIVSEALRMKRLIVTADDFGAAEAVNVAVEEGHQHGILTSASLMVAAPACADAVARAKRLPKLRVGLHLVLVEGAPILSPSALPDLVRDGLFRTDMARMGAEILFCPGVRKQLAAEIEAQFEAFQRTGMALDHVNTHKHFHLHPTIAGMILRIGRRFGLRASRAPIEPWSVLAAVEPGSPPPKSDITEPWAKGVRSRYRKAGIVMADQVFGLAWSGAMTPDRVAGVIRHLPDGLSELYLHPATGGGFAGSAPGYRYAEEFAALTAPQVRDAVRDGGVMLGGFSDFA